ncbi:MAG: ABC transporter substrate-binding protein [Azospirillaceae bacterium]|nr:ABC transporter substrate-binding protein [Azospirillaceae bacterium]
MTSKSGSVSNGTSTALSRRGILKVAGATGLATSLGVIGKRFFIGSAAAAPVKVRLSWTEVAACHSPVAFGAAKGFFQRQGVDIELYNQGATGQTLIQSLATNKADLGLGLVYDFLKPLEQGFDVKLVVGTHGGCQRLLTTPASGITDIKGLKGKTIASWDVASPPRVTFGVALAKSGLDPENDVTWKVFPFELLGEVLKKGQADAIGHMDPWAWGLIKEQNLVTLAETSTGFFKDRVCCLLGASGDFLKNNRDAVRRVAAATLEVHEYTASHPEEVAQYYVDLTKPGISVADLTENLAALRYHNHPVGEALIEQIRLATEDLKLVNLLESDTDPAEFSRRITDSILS